MSETTTKYPPISRETLTEMRRVAENAPEGQGVGITAIAFLAVLDAASRAETLQAQLTEVTRERDAIQATYDEFCAKFPSKSVMRRQAAMREPADPSAPTPEKE